MTLELTAVELLRLSYMLSLAKENTKQDEIIDTANRIEELIVEQIESLYTINY